MSSVKSSDESPVLCALLFVGLFHAILVGVEIDHGSHLDTQHVLDTKPSRQTHIQNREKGTKGVRHTQLHTMAGGKSENKSICKVLKIEATSNIIWATGLITCTQKVQKGPLTYGPKCGDKWSWTPIHQEVNGRIGGGQWSQHISKYRHQSTDLSTGRLVTVDIDDRFDYTHGTIRSISTVDSIPLTEKYGRSLIVDQ